MTDEVRVTRNPGSSDNTWDEGAGRYIDNGVDTTKYQGPASIVDLGSRPRAQLEAGQEQVVSTLTISIPLESDKLSVDDLVEVLASMRNPHLIGEMFRVREHRYTTFAISQQVQLEHYEGERPR